MTSREKVTPHARLTYMNFCLLLDLRLVIIYYYVALPMSFQQIFFIVFFLLQFIDIVFFFLKTEGLWQPYIGQVYQHHFSNSIIFN